ncbi:MAG TPA: AAA family ATPase [Candidatus Lokiarchaeia archaeon]|nr:AAA family ATPase [Candidatus Lokiarchaeia archaeon]
MVRFFPPFPPGDDRQEPDIYPTDLSRGHIGLIWGDWGIGKTTLALQATLNEVSSPDTHTWYLTSHQYPVLQRALTFLPLFPAAELRSVHVVQVDSFRQLREKVDEIEYIAYLARKANHPISLMVIDSVTNLYTLVLGKKESSVKRNQELNQLLGFLKYAAKRWEFSVLLTGEEKFRDVENIIERKPAGGRMMDYWVDFSLKVSRGRSYGSRVLELKKHPAGMRGTWEASISEAGMQLTKIKRKKAKQEEIET